MRHWYSATTDVDVELLALINDKVDRDFMNTTIFKTSVTIRAGYNAGLTLEIMALKIYVIIVIVRQYLVEELPS